MSLSQPTALPEGGYTVAINADDGSGVPKGVAFPFEVYDGNLARVVSASPSTVPTTLVVNGAKLLLESEVSALVANFPQGLSPSEVVALNPERYTLAGLSLSSFSLSLSLSL